MKAFLVIFFTAVLAAMIGLTTVASLDRGIFVALDELWPDFWFRATLADAYFAFLTVYLWVAWRERTIVARLVWLVLFLGLGSIAIAIYMLLALFGVGGRPPLIETAGEGSAR